MSVQIESSEFNSNERSFKYNCRIYIEDTDAGGIVYYVNYLKFMERARTEALRAMGMQQKEWLQDHINFVVHSANIRYQKPAYMDDLLIVETQIHSLKKTSLSFHQKIYRANEAIFSDATVIDNELIADAQIKVACLNRDTGRPQVFPAEMLVGFKQFEIKE